MTTRTRFASTRMLLVCVLLSAGCKKTQQLSGIANLATGVAHVGLSGRSLDESRRLALSKLTGTPRPVDVKIGELLSLLEHNPTKLDGWLLLAQRWIQKARDSGDPGFYVNADAAVDIALSLAPGHVMARTLRGIVLLNNHQFEAARALAEELSRQHPDDPNVAAVWSDALLELGRFEDAASAAQKMMDLKPNLPAYVRASYLRFIQGDVASAKRYAKLAIEAGADQRDPEPHAFAIVQAAWFFWLEGDFEGVDAGLDMADKVRPDYPAALVLRARVKLARGDTKGAAELARKAEDLSPLLETTWLLIDALEQLADNDGAARAIKRLELHGRSSDPRTLSLFWSTRKREADAALSLAETESKTRGDVYTVDALALALHRKGRNREALDTIIRARRLGTTDPRLIFHEGLIRHALGESAGLKLIQQALTMNPFFDVVLAAEGRALLAAAGVGSTAGSAAGSTSASTPHPAGK